ncbi:MAG: GC-type dockerin domain-anchored protein [Phycisphaerales bacterium]
MPPKDRFAIVVSLALSSALAPSVLASAPRDAACPTCVVELHVVLDTAWQLQFADDADQVAMDVVAAANEIYAKPQDMGGLDLDVTITGLTDVASPQPWTHSNNPSTLLSNFRAWSSLSLPLPGEHRDVVMLFTGANLEGSTIGIIYPQTLCSHNAIGVLSSFSPDTDDLGAALAYLLGRILGAQIDGVGNNCAASGYVMSGIIQVGNPATQFSLCSIDEINAAITASGDCLAAAAPCNDADLAEPFATLDFSDVLAFVTAFGAMDADADLATPFGVFDFSDVFAFLVAFGAGCP